MSELKQTNQFTKVVSLILGIVDKYLASKIKEAVSIVVQLQTNKLREEAQADNQEFLNQANKLDNQKNLYNTLVESYNSNKDIITSNGDVVILKRGRDDQDKDEDPSTRSDRGTKRKKSGKDAESSKNSRSKEKKSSSTSKDASQLQHKSFGKSSHVEEPSRTSEDLCMQQDQKFVTRDNDEQPTDMEVTKPDWFKKPERPLTLDPDWSKRQHVDF
nr:hypothetical protein [Tanacetum cinerariifolium]